MLQAIEWRHMPVVGTRPEASEAWSSIRNGEHFGIFIPAGCKLAEELNANFSDKNYVPSLAVAAQQAGLIEEAKYRDRFDVGDVEDTREELEAHVDISTVPLLNIHRTNLGKVAVIFMRPQDGYVQKGKNWHKTGSDRQLSRMVRSGVLDLEDHYIEPLVEIAWAGPGDRVAFIESPPIAPSITAKPTPHWFYSLTFARNSTLTRYQ